MTVTFPKASKASEIINNVRTVWLLYKTKTKSGQTFVTLSVAVKQDASKQHFLTFFYQCLLLTKKTWPL